MNRLHREYPDDDFQIRDWPADSEIGGYYDGFKVFCCDCNQRTFNIETFKINNPEKCLVSVDLHLRTSRHTSNVLLRLKREEKVPQETPACKSRMASLQRLADQKGYSLNSMSLFIEHCATGSFSPPSPLAQTSDSPLTTPANISFGRVPITNSRAATSISHGEKSKPATPSKGPLFGRTQQEADQDTAFLDSLFAAKLPSPVLNPIAQAETPMESQSLTALRSEFSRRLDNLELQDRHKKILLNHQVSWMNKAENLVNNTADMGVKIMDLESWRDDYIRAAGREDTVMRAHLRILKNAQTTQSTAVDEVSGQVDRLETRTVNVQKLVLQHSQDIKKTQEMEAVTKEALKRHCKESAKTESEIKKAIIIQLQRNKTDLQKESHAFRIETEKRFETLLQTVQEKFETLSKRQKEDVDALRKEIKDLEMVGEQQKSQISNLKTQLSLQIAQIAELALDDGAHAVLPLLLFNMAIDISEILPVGWKCSYKCLEHDQQLCRIDFELDLG
jgi:hypothetical protein